ncbi:hypothetical protein [Actimicrobium antarcticum]|uniref:Outer membrane protein beta-barrel domain-containing protein n=1 Tax=Actimicrobium antarcticum TaxID=1051899 RepID=A0ABP7SSY7_9BURK
MRLPPTFSVTFSGLFFYMTLAAHAADTPPGLADGLAAELPTGPSDGMMNSSPSAQPAGAPVARSLNMPASKPTGKAISLLVGTTGLAIHGVGAINSEMNARIGVNYFNNVDFSTNTKYVDWNLHLKLRTFDFLLDWFPWDSNFRFTSGVVFNRNQIEAQGTYANVDGIGIGGLPFTSFTYQGVDYNVSQVGGLKGKIDFQPVSPYLGMGWGNALKDGKGWGLSSDVGILFQGSPTSRTSAENCTLPSRACEMISILLASEDQRLNDKLKRFRAYPVIRVGVNYRF